MLVLVAFVASPLLRDRHSWLNVTPTRALFGDGAIERAGVVHGPAGKPAGVRYDARLDPSKRYLLSTDASSASYGLNLTIVADGAPEWAATPSQAGPLRIVEGVSQLSLIFFATDGLRYDAPRVTLEACSSRECPTNADLRRQIMAELPALQGQLDRGATVRAARSLLRWTSTRITYAANEGAVMKTTEPMSAARLYYDYFVKRRAGVYCWGAADFYAKVLDLFGIDAVRADFGIVDDGLTHATVLVPARGPRRVRYLMFDPTFGIELRRNGRPADLLRVLRDVREGRDVAAKRVVDLAPRVRVAATDASGEARLRATTCRADGRSSGCSLGYWSDSAATVLARRGLSTGLRGLLELMAGPGLFAPSVASAPPEFQARYSAWLAESG